MPERVEWMETVPELDRFRVLAGDGTYLAEACHGGTPGEPKTAVGQLFTLDLRTGGLNHLALAEPAVGNSKEHEMRALKRTAVEARHSPEPRDWKPMFQTRPWKAMIPASARQTG